MWIVVSQCSNGGRWEICRSWFFSLPGRSSGSKLIFVRPGSKHLFPRSNFASPVFWSIYFWVFHFFARVSVTNGHLYMAWETCYMLRELFVLYCLYFFLTFDCLFCKELEHATVLCVYQRAIRKNQFSLSHPVGSGIQWAVVLGSKVLYPLSCLTGSPFKFFLNV